MLIFESTRTVYADQSRRQLWRESLWWFMSLQQLRFRWRLPSQQGLCAQTKPSVSWGSSFGDDFRAESDSVFGCDFRVKWDYVRWRIEASSGKAMSLMVSTKFLLAISESIGTLCADESTRQLWKHCRWWFLSRQLLSFRWWFLINRDYVRRRIPASPVEAVSLIVFESAATQFSLGILQSTGYLCADESRRQLWRQTRWLFLSRQLLSIRWQVTSQQGVYVQTNPSISCETSFGEDFKCMSDSVFDVDFRVNLDCVRWPIQASAVKRVSVMVYEFSTTLFSVTITDSIGTVCTDKTEG
jgi:hypothetical protein